MCSSKSFSNCSPIAISSASVAVDMGDLLAPEFRGAGRPVMPSGRCLFVVALPRRRPEVDGFVCAGRSVRNLWRAQMFAEWSPHNNILRASLTSEANLVRSREILRSSSCAPIWLRRSMIAVSERICRCARVMSSCAVIRDTREARECPLAPPSGAFIWDRRARLIPLQALVA